MRAFDQINGAASLIDGWRVHYDIIRDYMAPRMTPTEVAGIPKIEEFRWLKLLKLTTTRNITSIKQKTNHPIV